MKEENEETKQTRRFLARRLPEGRGRSRRDALARHQGDRGVAGAAGHGQRQHHQGGDGAADEDQPRRAGPPARPGNGAVTLQTLTRAAHAIGRGLRIELV